jgi:NAD(P)-dependent dehydrogenase (short-subunit alcohol dehydrogenase family)
MPTILITGAGRGLGLELARQYAKDGWQVIGTARASSPKLEATGARVLELEVDDFPAAKRISRALKGEAIDVLFCNAGIIGKRGMTLGRFDYAEWEKVLRVNLLGAAAAIEALSTMSLRARARRSP